MTEDQRELLNRIEAFSFDEGAPAGAFVSRLSKDNGWEPRYGARILDEYRRFAFLLAAAGHMVAPSDQVDQAWHQHVLHTRSWLTFSTDVLAQTVHHDPARGGAEEHERFFNAYQRTLETYRIYFGKPPADIWPTAASRFGPRAYFRRVNLAENVVLSRTSLLHAGVIAAACAAAALLAWVS